MLSFKNNENKKPILFVKNKDNKKVGEVFLFDKKNEKVDGFYELEIEDSHHFQLIPDLNKKRDFASMLLLNQELENHIFVLNT